MTPLKFSKPLTPGSCENVSLPGLPVPQHKEKNKPSLLPCGRCSPPKPAIAIANAIARKQRKKRKQQQKKKTRTTKVGERGEEPGEWGIIKLTYHNVEAEDSGGRGAVVVQRQWL